MPIEWTAAEVRLVEKVTLLVTCFIFSVWYGRYCSENGLLQEENFSPVKHCE